MTTQHYHQKDLTPMAISHETVLERERARPVHAELLGDMPGVIEIDAQTQEMPIDSVLPFEKTPEGNVAHPLVIDFVGMGLPIPPDDEQPLAVITTRNPKGPVESVALVLHSATRSEPITRYLEDVHQTADDTSLQPEWVMPGNAARTGRGYHVRTVADTDKVLTVALGWRGYDYESKPDSLHVLRAEPSVAEKRLSAVDETKARHQKLSKARVWLAGLVVTSGLLGGTYHAEAAPPPAKSYLEYRGSDYSKAAVQRLNHNLQLLASGHQAKLKVIAEKSGFTGDTFGDDDVHTVEKASSVDDIEKIMQNELAKLDIGFTVRHAGVVRQDGEVSQRAVSETRQTALGILDGLNDLGPLISDGQPFDIELVKHIYDDDEEGPDPIGEYYERGQNGQSKPMIRMSLQSQSSRASTVLKHEDGHHEVDTNGVIRLDFSSLDDGTVQYGPDGLGNGKVGRDIVSAYAGESPDEDAAEMMADLFGDSPKIDIGGSSLLDQKLKYILASLESSHPGTSAAILAHAKPTQGMQGEPFGDHIDAIRSQSRKIFVASFLLELGVLAALADTKQRMQAQRNAAIV